MQTPDLMEKIVSLCKRRGFIFPGSEIYGGLANSWDYGPLGAELKNNIKQLWWDKFVRRRDDVVGIDAAIIMNPKVWEASGHIATFSDPLVDCNNCKNRYRADDLIQNMRSFSFHTFKNDLQELITRGFYNEELEIKLQAGDESTRKFYEFLKKYKIETDRVEQFAETITAFSQQFDLYTKFPTDNELYSLIIWLFKVPCLHCGKIDAFTDARQFNLMFKTFLGPVEDQKSIVYLRPETAQAMFVNFKNILDTMRKTVPFGIAQIGKSFRNEITPGNFIFRTREFEQMEIEYFIRENDWKKYFEIWHDLMRDWMKHDLGLDMKKIHELEVPEEDRAHYSKRTVDFEYDFPFGTEELYGLAYRGDFDLKNHQEKSGQSLEYMEPQTNEKFLPHVIEPTWGVDRSALAVLCNSYDDSNPERVVLHLPLKLAPYKAAVFPLLKNKPELVAKAREIYDALRAKFPVAWDDRGNVGKRYYSQDEIGTPFGITVDFETLEDNAVTVRDRDTTKQERVAITELAGYISSRI